MTRQDDGVLGFTTVRIVGPSMEPGLRNGDWWLVRRTSAVGPGDVVLVRHPLRRELLIVKRVARADGTGWWVLGDDPAMSDDSREFGVVARDDVVGRLVWRYRPLRRR